MELIGGEGTVQGGAGGGGRRPKQGDIEVDHSPGEVASIEEELVTLRRREGDVLYGDKNLTVSRTTTPDGLRFAGEIDISNSSSLAEAIWAGFPDGGDPHLDLSGVSFCDISGIRVLVDIALEMGPGRRLLLHGLPAQLETVMKVTGWADLPGLELCSCEIDY